MSLHEYMVSQSEELTSAPFYALIMAAMRKADDVNIELLKKSWPGVWDELYERYHSPGGVLDGVDQGITEV